MEKPFEIKGRFPGMFCKLTPPWECSVCQLLLSDLFSFFLFLVCELKPVGRLGEVEVLARAMQAAVQAAGSRAEPVLCCACVRSRLQRWD